MNATDYLPTLRRRWWVVVLAGILGGLVGWGLSALVSPTYTATSQVFVYQSLGNTAADLSNGSTFTHSQIASFAEMASTPVVLDPVIKGLDLATSADALSRTMTITNPQDTTILTISASNGSAAVAAKIANAVARQFAIVIDEVAPVNDDGKTTVAVKTIAPASPPTEPSSPRTTINIGLGVVAGLLASGLLLFARLRFDTRVRTKDDLARLTSVPGITSISRSTAEGLVMLTQPNSVAAENFRQLRTDLQFSAIDDQTTSLVITSSLAGEGKTTIACNLALAWAETGARILLIDADLHRPSIADRFGLEGRAGLTTVLVGRAKLSDVVRRWGGSTLDVLPSGGVPPNPSELIASKRMVALMDDVLARYDVVLIDSTPGSDLAAPAVLARQSSGTLIVADSTSIRGEQLQTTVRALTTAGVHIVGITLNKVKQTSANYSYEGPLPVQQPDRGPAKTADL